MSDRLHVGTLLWGVVLTITGAALATAGFGWWHLSSIDLRYAAPALVILVGLVILLGSLMPDRRDHTQIDPTV